MSQFETEMSEHNGEWSEEDLAKSGGNILPDGQHQVRVQSARCEMSPWDTWQFVLVFVNDEGVITKWQNLDTDVGRKIALQDANMLGADIGNNISKLEAACEGGVMLDKICDINVKTKPGDTRDFTNIYLNRVLGVATDVESFVPAEPAADDIPF